MSRENDWIIAYLIQRLGGSVTIPPRDVDAWGDSSSQRRWAVWTSTDEVEGVTWTVYEMPVGTPEERIGEAAGLLDIREQWAIERAKWLLTNGRDGEPHWDKYALWNAGES